MHEGEGALNEHAPHDSDTPESASAVETPSVPATPQPRQASFDEFVFRPAEFRPAVFVSAEPPPVSSEPPHFAPSPVSTTADTRTVPKSWAVSASRVGEELVAWFKTLVSAAVYATLIVTFGFQVARVEGQSMVPTLEDQDRLIVNKLAYRLGDPQVGDIVMLYYPEDPEKSFVKRVIGEEHDTLRSVNGRVYRNEVLLNDDFIPDQYKSEDSWGPTVVRKGYYFVMGDHRNNSSDSREWGEVPRKYIIGKVQLRWWPLSTARIFH
jgi:signal peptidase I